MKTGLVDLIPFASSSARLTRGLGRLPKRLVRSAPARAGVFVLIAALLTTLLAGPVTQARAQVTYQVQSGVSAENQDTITEGVGLAQDVLAAQWGGDLTGNVSVAIKTSTSAPAGGAGNGTLTFNTGNAVWVDTTVRQRVKIAVHEYVHLWQSQRSNKALGWAWIVEGSAEFVAFQAIIDKGLISPAEVRAFHVAIVTSSSTLPELQAMETSISAPGPVYSLAYLAVESLVTKSGPDSLIDYFDLRGDGQSHAAAFSAAFGLSSTTFYSQFAAERAALQPVNPPASLLPPGTLSSTPSELTLLSVTSPVSRGEQAVVTARTSAGVRCNLSVFSPEGDLLDERASSSDRAGVVDWIWRVQTGQSDGRATLEADCGADAIEIPIWIGPGKPDGSATLTLSKEKSKYNGWVIATLSGFAPESPVSITWPRQYEATSGPYDGQFTRILVEGITDGVGAATLRFRTPLEPVGDYVVTARDGTNQAARETLRVIPRIMLNETSGPPDTRLRVYFYGFGPGEVVEVRWHVNDSTSSSYVVIKRITVAANGRASTLVPIPAGQAAGGHRVVGKVIGVSRSTTTTFTLTGASAAEVDDSVATPVVSVEATPGVSAEPTVDQDSTVEPTIPVEPTAEPTEEPTTQTTPDVVASPEATAVLPVPPFDDSATIEATVS